MATVTTHSRLTTMPLEIRRQILIDTISAEITDYVPHPFGYRIIPFDRLVHTVFAKEAYLLHHECRVWGRSGFWHREPMTRLMRVNKQLYEEVYSILWSDFALSLWNSNVDENHTEWMHLLQRSNPRAIPLIRHLHLRLNHLFNRSYLTPENAAKSFESDAKQNNMIIQKQIKSYPGLVSVRLQLGLIGESGMQPKEIQERFREDVMRYVASCGTDIRVMVFWEPDADIPWAAAIIQDCQDRISQTERDPFLHGQFLKQFPATRKEDPYK